MQIYIMSDVFIKRISPDPDTQPLNQTDDNERFWQTIEGLPDNIVTPSFFVIKVMTEAEGQFIREAINGAKVLYFDEHGNIFVRPGNKDNTEFEELCPGETVNGQIPFETRVGVDSSCLLINNPLTEVPFSKNRTGIITQGFLQTNRAKNTIMSFKDPSTIIDSDYTDGNTFTNKKIILAPSLKWIIYTDDNNVVKLLYNPIHSRGWKNITKDNLQVYESKLLDYCQALQTNRPDGTSNIVMNYFADPTCNGYFSNRTCINSGEGINIFDSLKEGQRNEFDGRFCLCKSPSFNYRAQNLYDKDDTFLEQT